MSRRGTGRLKPIPTVPSELHLPPEEKTFEKDISAQHRSYNPTNYIRQVDKTYPNG